MKFSPVHARFNTDDPVQFSIMFTRESSHLPPRMAILLLLKLFL